MLEELLGDATLDCAAVVGRDLEFVRACVSPTSAQWSSSLLNRTFTVYAFLVQGDRDASRVLPHIAAIGGTVRVVDIGCGVRVRVQLTRSSLPVIFQPALKSQTAGPGLACIPYTSSGPDGNTRSGRAGLKTPSKS